MDIAHPDDLAGYGADDAATALPPPRYADTSYSPSGNTRLNAPVSSIPLTFLTARVGDKGQRKAWTGSPVSCAYRFRDEVSDCYTHRYGVILAASQLDHLPSVTRIVSAEKRECSAQRSASRGDPRFDTLSRHRLPAEGVYGVASKRAHSRSCPRAGFHHICLAFDSGILRARVGRLTGRQAKHLAS